MLGGIQAEGRRGVRGRRPALRGGLRPLPHFPYAETPTGWDRDFAARGVDIPLPERAPAERRKHSRAWSRDKECALSIADGVSPPLE